MNRRTFARNVAGGLLSASAATGVALAQES